MKMGEDSPEFGRLERVRRRSFFELEVKLKWLLPCPFSLSILPVRTHTTVDNAAAGFPSLSTLPHA